jgi:INO80 complex subunit C
MKPFKSTLHFTSSQSLEPFRLIKIDRIIIFTMAPITQASDESNHQALLDQLDLFALRRPFRNPHWKPPQRRNKNVKQIISEASRKEASMMSTQNNSGASTPARAQSDAATGGAQTPMSSTAHSSSAGNIVQAAQRLDRLVLERNQQQASIASVAGGGGGAVGGTPMTVTYTNIESAPSLHPASQKHYCDITGLSAPYTDPKSRLRYHNVEIFALIRQLGQSGSEQYLAARGAHTVLK